MWRQWFFITCMFRQQCKSPEVTVKISTITISLSTARVINTFIRMDRSWLPQGNKHFEFAHAQSALTDSQVFKKFVGSIVFQGFVP